MPTFNGSRSPRKLTAKQLSAEMRDDIIAWLRKNKPTREPNYEEPAKRAAVQEAMRKAGLIR